jgi:Holliday junction resolvase RusA-like endonuclease
MRGQEPLQGPLALAIDFYLPITPGWPLWKRQAAAAGEIAPTLKPDLDNFIKSGKDACNSIVWGDDSQICRLTSSKGYALAGRVEVSVLLLDHLQPAQVSRRPLPKPVEA